MFVDVKWAIIEGVGVVVFLPRRVRDTSTAPPAP